MRIRNGKFCSGLLSGAAVLSLAFAGVAHAEVAEYKIAPQPLDDALQAFSRQSGHPMIVDMDLVRQKRSPGVVVSASPEAALRKLLNGTGLDYRRDGEVFAIVAAQVEATRRAPAAPVAVEAETVSGSAVEGLVVTAQKRRENIQDVPIAISAFNADTLQAQKIEGGFDLLKAIPNVTFSKNNFTGYNFSIRGIGTKAISATTDPGVAVAFNSTGLIQNRLFEQEYFDIERVEVLRGPQGTLYGRNATSGVINLISNKADLEAFDGQLKGEVGNYHAKRLSGFINVPLIEDILAVRFAGSMTDREGYDYNSITRNAVNGRDLWSGRLSIGFAPTERVHADFIWERFNEDDNRSRTGKQLCHRDDGPEYVGDAAVADGAGSSGGAHIRRALFGQGCKPGSLYDDAAFGTPNGLSYNFVLGVLSLRNAYTGVGRDANNVIQTIIQDVDPYGGMMQSRDLRTIASGYDPRYRANADLLELNVSVDLTDQLTLVSQTLHNEDQVYSFQDYNRFNTVPIFTDTSVLTRGSVTTSNPTGSGPTLWRNLAPGGIFCDPQLGCSNTMMGFDISQASAEQFSQEIRLQSSFEGPVNFAFGANYTRFEVLADYYVMFNVITAMAMISPFNFSADSSLADPPMCYASNWAAGTGAGGVNVPVPLDHPNSVCPYIDPNPVESINGEGHNYFRSKNPYRLKSWAAFGELYYQINDELKLTAGLRYTDDSKAFTPVPTQVLLSPGLVGGGTVAKGYPEDPPINQKWGEWTGRLVLDWQPDIGFTDDSLFYVSYARGYKGGGANPPSPGFVGPEGVQSFIDRGMLSQQIFDALQMFPNFFPILNLTAVEYGPTFEPEFVDAYELGAKNTLFGGAVTFNTTAFYYDYKDYQVSQIRDRTAVNENFDAKTWGIEFETMFAPSRNLQIIANLGYLDTEIADGETSIDIMNRTQDNPNYTLVKPWVQLPSNCVIPTHVAESWVENSSGLQEYWELCGGLGGLVGLLTVPRLSDPATGQPYDPLARDANGNLLYPEINGGGGLYANLGGNELPNAPHWTANIGMQYSWDMLGDWSATVRGDAYWQSQSWARVYNSDPYDKLHGWYNANLSFWIEKPTDDLRIEFYVKNVLDDTPITDAFLNSDDTGLTTNIFTLDPRLIGLQVTKGF